MMAITGSAPDRLVKGLSRQLHEGRRHDWSDEAATLGAGKMMSSGPDGV